MSEPVPPAVAPAPGGWRMWLLVSMIAVFAAALFAGSRTKPPFLFALGFGIGLGIVLRLLAEACVVPRSWRITWAASLIIGCGFLISFLPSYRRAESQWEQWRTAPPTDPLAIAILSQAPPEEVAPPPRYSIARFLSQRSPGQPDPWPQMLFGAEWLLCVACAACCVGVGRRAVSVE